jgi:hypothetical protein
MLAQHLLPPPYTPVTAGKNAQQSHSWLKNLCKIFASVFIFSVLAACGGGSSGGGSATAPTGSVRLSLSAAGSGFQISQAPAQSAAANSASPQVLAAPAVSAAPAVLAAPTLNATPTQIHLVLQSASGTTINKDLNLLSLGGQYITTPFSLPVGNYSITQYLVADSTGKVIYATPVKTGSTAYLVKNPLPISMTVTKDTVTTLAPEIIDTTLIATSDFGANSFTLNIVPTQNFLIAPFAYDSTAATMAYTTASLNITNNGQTVYSGTVDAKTNTVIIPTLTTDYTVTVTKAGYQTVAQTVTAAAIQTYVSAPLDVYLKAAGLNDTGVTQCFAAGSSALVSCTSSEAVALSPAQDGMVGRDVSSTNSSDGRVGFSYSLVENSVASFYEKTECVRDNITSLVWEGKPLNGGFRDATLAYTNYGDNRTGDASAYIAAVNSAALCGYTDWRLPTVDELVGIVDYGSAQSPKIDITWLPNTQNERYWTSTEFLFAAGTIFGVDFATGDNLFGGSYVRLVRGGLPAGQQNRYLLNVFGDEVTDSRTGLTWQRCFAGYKWNGSACAADNSVDSIMTLPNATIWANAKVGWRMPNIKEINSFCTAAKSDAEESLTSADKALALNCPYVSWSSSLDWVVISNGIIARNGGLTSGLIGSIRLVK